MFGYVKAYMPELRVREAEFYRAVYCGLCRTMRAKTGLLSTVSLSYDMVFLVITRLALSGDRYAIKKRRCMKLRRRPMMERGAELEYAAAVSALLTHEKVQDDRRDERGFRRIAAVMLSPSAKRWLRRAKCGDDLVSAVQNALAQLSAYESERHADISVGAHIFGELLGDVFAYGIIGDNARLAREIGRGVGRAVYIIDAADDIIEDRHVGRYNPIAALWESEISDCVLSERARSAVFDSVKLELSAAGAAAELIEVPEGGYPEALEILKNVIFLGLPDEAERVIYKKTGGGKGEGSV